MTPRRVLVAAGGTAGHVMPALAVAEELVRAGAEVTFAGTPDRAEARARARRAATPSIRFRVAGPCRARPSLAASPGARTRRRGAGRLRAHPAPPAAARRARRRRLRGRARCCSLRGRSAFPRVLTEADAHLGARQPACGPARRPGLPGLPAAGREPPRYEVVGRPVARAYFETTRAEARAELGLPADAFVLAVFGALAGARRINDACVGRLRRARPRRRDRPARHGHARLRACRRGRDARRRSAIAISRRPTASGRCSPPPTSA